MLISVRMNNRNRNGLFWSFQHIYFVWLSCVRTIELLIFLNCQSSVSSMYVTSADSTHSMFGRTHYVLGNFLLFPLNTVFISIRMNLFYSSLRAFEFHSSNRTGCCFQGVKISNRKNLNNRVMGLCTTIRISIVQQTTY